ncbi:MAG: alpha/beta fold hydrolase [Nitrospiria bacterium]
MDEKEVKVTGARIVYFQGGDGPALALLPSAGGRGKEFKDIFPFLTPFFSVYSLDYPGFGRSGELKEVDSVEKLADFTMIWLKTIGVDSFFLAGFSMGGAIALQIGLKASDQIRKLCVIATAAGKINDIPIISPVGLNMKEILAFFYHRAEIKERIKNEKLTTDEKKEIHRSSQTFARMIKNSKVFTNILNLLPAIHCQTLVIGAENDLVVPIPYQKAIFDQLPHAEWKSFPETGHFIIVERPKELALELTRFFNETPV